MEFIGIDVHKRDSQVCILAEGGEVVLEQRLRTQRERLGELLGKRPKARVLLEASTESEWVARSLEELGHEVVVADPNLAPMYATRSRRVKTDKRDARTLAEACKLGAYRPAHRTSEARRHMRAQLAVREALVRTRTRSIALVGALVRREGLRIGDGKAESFVKRVAVLPLPGWLKAEVAPLLSLMLHLNAQIAFLDGVLERLAHQDEQVERVCTVPQVGPVTACAFVSAVDEPERFSGPHQLEASLGRVPGERSSGEKQRKGPITKTGNHRARGLLIQAALRLLRAKKPETAHLREWAERIAARRGKKTAVVALARRLAGILFAMMRDGTEYPPPKPAELEAAA
ncbi:IS110 family RNA-guided transposase [Pyxidicoccus xibeiensis]|uniref:IS110 family transposase n=1 Tax=Pyxidicoccus xibeiensis TaxID=2906759 RepID=UPI0020A6F742|nr:IS110 family transposase [Pyxidicoccus xibeiensis]MCP3145014.1 IS110 family transposase [Pyxidicoccus xibeiensis]